MDGPLLFPRRSLVVNLLKLAIGYALKWRPRIVVVPVFFFLPGLSDPNSRQRSSGTARLARGPPVSTYLGDRAAGFEEEGCCESSLAINTFG